jgi:hypothetical protein
MAGSATDVRTWLRSQGHEVKARGAISAELQEVYDQAHAGGVVAGEVLFDVPPGVDIGVTEADFPPGTDDYPDAASPPAPPGRGERKPRTVKPPGRGLRERFFGGEKKKGPGRPRQARARANLSEFAQETWEDLSWLAAPVPPLAKIFAVQAPYAGECFDEAVKGTPVDRVLQPVARYSGAWRGMNGLFGPPVYVALICATGQRVPVITPDGHQVIDEDGQPLTVFDQRTQMMFQGLRYSLLQMAKISELNADSIKARAQASAERTQMVDEIIAGLFDLPVPGAQPRQGPPPPPPPPPQPAAGSPYQYPPESATVMTSAGADPGRP